MTDIYFTCAQTGLKRNLTQERAKERAMAASLAGICSAARAHEITRICARYELESDEFMTAEQKADRILFANLKG